MDRLLDPLTDALTTESASALLNLRADPEVEARIEGLRRKANEGALSPEKDAEYKDFVEAVDMVLRRSREVTRVYLAKLTQAGLSEVEDTGGPG